MLLAAVSLLALAVSNVSEGAGNNINGAEFGIFCTLLNTLDAEDIENVATEGLDQKANTAYTEIEHMFIMTSNESYYNEGPPDSPDSTGTVKPKAPEQISQWTTERKVWEETPYTGDPSKKKYTRKDRSLIPKQLGAKLDRSFARAKKIKSEIQTAAEAIEQKENEIRSALRRAMYGGQRTGNATAKPEPVAGDFENTYAAACYGASGPGKRLANDLVCLCSASASTSEETSKQSTDSAILTDTTNYGTSANALTRFTAIKQACKKVYQTYKVSAATLKGLTTAFMARLGHHSLSSARDLGAYTYGKGQDSANGCDGGAADGQSCVNYATLVKASGGTALDKAVAWLKEIGAAENAVLARFNLIKKKEAEQARIITLGDQMDELYQEALHADSENKQEPTTKASKSAEHEKEKYCTQHKNNKIGCTDANCIWKGKDGTSETEGECKPKDDEGQTNPAEGQGETANSEAKKCSNNKTEKDCKDGCKWEDNSCKDSSILVTKTFALSVVSAAFVALLF